jgi:hypothetical protein
MVVVFFGGWIYVESKHTLVGTFQEVGREGVATLSLVEAFRRPVVVDTFAEVFAGDVAWRVATVG